MKIKSVKYLQEGGQMAAPAQPAPQDQMAAQLEQMANEIINSLGIEGAAMLAEMIMQMLQSVQQPVGAPAEGQPVFRKGGKLARRVK